MNNKFREVMIALRGMWRYRWLGLILAWLIAMIGTVVLMSIPKKYEATARIFVNTDSILKPLMVGMTVQPSDEQRMAMLSRAVISRPNVEQIVKASGLDEKAKTVQQRDKVIDLTIKALEIKTSGASNLYVVSYRDQKPERAKQVVELLVSKFINTGVGVRELDTETAKKFIDEQVEIYEKKLEEAENKLKDFKLRNITVVEGQGKDYFVRISEAEAQLNQARLLLREAENSREALKRGLSLEDPLSNTGVISTGGGDSIAEIDARLDSMRRQLDGMLQKYTEGHPDVLGAKRQIAELQKQKNQLIEEHKRTGVPLIQSGSTGPSAYDQLRVSLAQADANVASLRARVAEYSARYTTLKELAKRMPELEAELAQLNRDYDVNKKNYESLVSRRESATISGDMQAVSEVADFRLVDPPRVSRFAVWPNRELLIPLILLIALSAGFGVPFAACELRPTFFDGQSLREVTGLPILGVVSFVAGDSIKSAGKSDLKKFLKWSGVLFASYIFMLALAYWLTSVPANVFGATS